MSESLYVRIVAGRPIHCQVPGIDHHLVSRAAVRATLEAAKAIAAATSALVKAASAAQRELVAQGKVGLGGRCPVQLWR